MTPYLSVVMVGRNDNYLGNFLDRLTKSVTNITTLLSKYTFDYEIVLVDWNPPKDRAKLSSLLGIRK